MVGTIVHDTLLLWLSVEQVEAALIDEQWHVALTQVLVGCLQCLQRPAADAHVECFSAAHDVDEGLERFLERCLRVVAVAVEQVHIVEVHALQALVEAGHEVFP